MDTYYEDRQLPQPVLPLAYATGALLASFAWALSHRYQATSTVIDRPYSGAALTVIDRRYSESGNTRPRTHA